MMMVIHSPGLCFVEVAYVGQKYTDLPIRVDVRVAVHHLLSLRSSWYDYLGCLSQRVRVRPTRRGWDTVDRG